MGAMKVNAIIPGALFVRGRSDHLPAADKAATLDALGIGTVANLWSREDPDLRAATNYIHHPMADGRLDPETVAGLEILAARLTGIIRAGDSVLVQCHAGRNRSGLLAALVARRVLGLSGKEALEYVRNARPDAVDNEWFEAYLEEGIERMEVTGDPNSAYQALIVIGEPGAGKSTLVEFITADLPHEESDSPFPFRRYDCGVLELGRRRPGGFGGTDALALNVQPAVVQFLEGVRPRLLLFEGDRLANGKMFTALVNMGYRLNIFELWGARAASAQRATRGSSQDAAWLAGRQTKVRGLRKAWGATTLAAGRPVDELANRMADPVSTALRKAKEVQYVERA